MQNYDIYKLEDNQNYIAIDRIIHNKIEYLLLCEENNHRNICVRKILEENNKKYLTTVSEEEFSEVINLFNKLEKNLN